MNYWDIYKDVWQFHKSHADIIDSDEYWKQVFDDAKDIARSMEIQSLLDRCL